MEIKWTDREFVRNRQEQTGTVRKSQEQTHILTEQTDVYVYNCYFATETGRVRNWINLVEDQIVFSDWSQYCTNFNLSAVMPMTE